jgi:drug/metabolite transporter (DMT)-like permease
VVFATSYGVTRVVLDDVPAATLGLARSLIGAVVLELLSPVLLGERLSRREAVGAALALAGAVIVVLDGIPGVTRSLAPHWRGDLLLILSGLAYAAYSLLGRDALTSHPVRVVTAWSIVWGALAMSPLAWLEWRAGLVPRWTIGATVGTLHLGLVITALGYAVWNWCLERLGASRVAIFVNVQPLTGALIGAWWLREPLTVFHGRGRRRHPLRPAPHGERTQERVE